MELSGRKLKKLLYFRRELAKPEKQTKKSALKKFLISYDVFTIFTAVKHREIPCEVKMQHRHIFIFNVT